MRFLVRIAVPLASVFALVQLARSLGGPRAAVWVGLTLLLAAAVRILLPRLAHRAFRRGAFRRAALLYRLLGWLRPERRVRPAVQVSLAACALGRERYRDALARLDRVDPAALGESARAAWHNNRAYALIRSGGDPVAALSESEAAVALRPDLSHFRHTRGLALLDQGRIDDALRELDAAWQRSGGELSPLLEAERCYDLGEAWSRKGEPDSAADYFERARRAAPGSPWSTRAAARLASPDRLPEALADLI